MKNQKQRIKEVTERTKGLVNKSVLDAVKQAIEGMVGCYWKYPYKD
jgi:hypothetical protein